MRTVAEGRDRGVIRALDRIARLLRPRSNRGPSEAPGPPADAASEALAEPGVPSDGRPGQRRQWFFDHYETAAHETIEFLTAGGVSLEGRVVADIGCGEGLTDLGLFHRARPSRLVGFDVQDTSPERLAAEAEAAGVEGPLPEGLEFVRSEPEHLPAPDRSFDVVITWSAFEHIDNPVAVLKEIRRVMRPDGVLFLQLWPFYYSEHGSHLWQWFPEGFCQIRFGEDEISRIVRSDAEADPSWIDMKLRAFLELNRMTLDELHADMREAGFRVARLEVISPVVQLPDGADDWPLSALATAGVKLLATPTKQRPRETKPVGRAFRA